ncbi:MAG: DUF3574 domain-containing protein [Phenylobacterium sp.]|uniref:DUF3574 domain-containing protein n=1 Tax=Phenylobacterium sp. TaxID=1871053 RepID=UPI002732FFB2|nr:DUF3574 domain-containing protein [Phenylobacterium sp.]MDP1643159.1 DUF3574 domain-containing protein [Phenylobacterium sp.]MDP3116622.1 DUF3574 domain-containing protein [Phenylobacterium sp.]MDP3382046.1 DUF3574 domain-containing protein [Phenylobacterium sp.]
MRLLAAMILGAMVLTGCATAPACGPDERAGQTAHLFFGRNIGEAPGVDEAAFRDFVARELAPRFPNGMTILDAEGRWSHRGALMAEASKIVILAQEGAIDRAALGAVRAAYRTRFSQESVLQSVSLACLAY